LTEIVFFFKNKNDPESFTTCLRRLNIWLFSVFDCPLPLLLLQQSLPTPPNQPRGLSYPSPVDHRIILPLLTQCLDPTEIILYWIQLRVAPCCCYGHLLEAMKKIKNSFTMPYY
jgi:hypothetical protein